MMKKRIFLGILAFGLVLCLSGSVYAQEFKPGTEPDGFRGIKWGTSIQSLPEMKFLKETDEGEKYYEREDDVLMLGDATLSDINYKFEEGRFCSASIDFQGDTNHIKILRTFLDAYGEVKKEEGLPLFMWRGKNVTLMLGYTETIEKGFVIWRYHFPTTWETESKKRTEEKLEKFEILEVKYRLVDKELWEDYVIVAWLVKVQNNTDAAKEVLVRVQFLDGEGFELDFDIQNASLRPGVVTDITHTTMLNRAIYQQIKSIRASF